MCNCDKFCEKFISFSAVQIYDLSYIHWNCTIITYFNFPVLPFFQWCIVGEWLVAKDIFQKTNGNIEKGWWDGVFLGWGCHFHITVWGEWLSLSLSQQVLSAFFGYMLLHSLINKLVMTIKTTIVKRQRFQSIQSKN